MSPTHSNASPGLVFHLQNWSDIKWISPLWRTNLISLSCTFNIKLGSHFIDHVIITNFLHTLPWRWSLLPQILQSPLVPKLLEKPVQGSSWWGRWRGAGCSPCGRRPPDDEWEWDRRKRKNWRLLVSIFSSDLCQVSPLHLLLHQKCALGHSPFPYHSDQWECSVTTETAGSTVKFY